MTLKADIRAEADRLRDESTGADILAVEVEERTCGLQDVGFEHLRAAGFEPGTQTVGFGPDVGLQGHLSRSFRTSATS